MKPRTDGFGGSIRSKEGPLGTSIDGKLPVKEQIRGDAKRRQDTCYCWVLEARRQKIGGLSALRLGEGAS